MRATRPSTEIVMTSNSPTSGNAYDEPYDDGLDVEVEGDEIIHPFDPEKIKIRTKNVLVAQVISRITDDAIDLAPDFQRKAGIWTPRQRSRLIESLLLRIPIPVFYVAADENDRWAVVDGIQRISTIDDFAAGRLPLVKLEYLKRYEDAHYVDLPRPMQRRIEETELVVNIIEPGTPEEVMFNIFHRINSGGTRLNRQEIRHALHPGPVREYLARLAGAPEFLDATNNSINPDRMADRDCVLRFLAFFIEPWEGYASNDLDGYLGSIMKRINAMDACRLAQIEQDFIKAMRAAEGIFGEHAFRKRFGPNHPPRPVNRSLFEAWSVGLARRSEAELDRLVPEGVFIMDDFAELMNEQQFDRSISYGTSTPAKIKLRFRSIEDLIKRYL